jgi:hypothetical protein
VAGDIDAPTPDGRIQGQLDYEVMLEFSKDAVTALVVTLCHCVLSHVFFFIWHNVKKAVN